MTTCIEGHVANKLAYLLGFVRSLSLHASSNIATIRAKQMSVVLNTIYIKRLIRPHAAGIVKQCRQDFMNCHHFLVVAFAKENHYNRLCKTEEHRMLVMYLSTIP